MLINFNLTLTWWLGNISLSSRSSDMPTTDIVKVEQLTAKPASFELNDLLEMQTEFALIKSVSQSKTLAAMLFIGVTFFSAFGVFLFHMAPS